jgi:hypothetical protein
MPPATAAKGSEQSCVERSIRPQSNGPILLACKVSRSAEDEAEFEVG